ncbi:MAG: carbohydrate ABC transporter permease [Clostridium sp.]|nr:carbohydrate ABC transporter permease [Clostridium sp.]
MKKRHAGLNSLRYSILVLILLFLLFPIYWMVVTALKSNMEAYLYPPTFVPEKPTAASFYSLLTVNNQFFVYYKNNFIVAGFAALISTFVALISGYGLSRFHFRWNRWIMASLMASQMFPVVSRMISLYGLLGKVHLINTRTGLILAVVAAQIPFCVMLMAGFYDGVPRELEEAAMIDGSKRFQTLFQVICPLVKPGIVAVGIYSFLMTWDDYLHAATLIQTDSLRTLSVGIALRYLGELSYDWSLVNAISVIGALPMILLFIFFQKYMVKGLVAGAVKG